MRAVARLALAGLLLCVTPAAAVDPAPATGTLGVRLLDGDSRYLVATVEPGEILRRRIEVSNGSAEPLDVELYAAAATQEGEVFDFAEGRTPNQLSRWTSVRPTSVQVPAGRAVVATVEVRVPQEAPEGELQAVVWAERGTRGGNGLTLVSRVGLRVYLTVQDAPGTAGPAALAVALVLLAGAGWAAARRTGAKDHASAQTA